MLTSLFLRYAEATLFASVAILPLRLLSARSTRRYGAGHRYWAWLVVAVFLILPVRYRLPQPPIVISLPAQTAVAEAQRPLASPKAPEPGAPAHILQGDATETDGVAAKAASPSPLNILAAVWAGGAALFLLTHLAAYRSFRRATLDRGRAPTNPRVSALIAQIQSELRLTSPVVPLVAQVAGPATIGFFRPHLLLPHDSYPDQALYYLLKHELIHLRRRDLWYKLLLLAATAVHWYNPAVHLMFRTAYGDLELSCDDIVARQLSQAQRVDYGRVILSCADPGGRQGSPLALSNTLEGDKRMLKERLRNLTTPGRRGGRWVVLAVAAGLFLSGALVACAPRVEASGSEEQPDSHSEAEAPPAKVYDAAALEELFRSDQAGYQEKSAAVQQRLDQVYLQTNWSPAPYQGGQLLWPAPEHQNIASHYGWRFDSIDYHTGIDITGADCYGGGVVAANDGTVQYVEAAPTPGEGLGLFLILDHGGGVSTLYAQCSSILVNAGDTVEQGQKIAEIGSSGLSTGPHLHFEVRTDGKHLSPLLALAEGWTGE